jgi:predicted aspartyl protease
VFQAEFAGHHVPARIHRDSLQPIDEGQAPFIPSNALIDTGASYVFIDPSVAATLNLKQVDQGEIETVGQRVGCAVYSGILEVEDLHFKQRMNLWAPTVRRMSYQIVLGRDFLKHFAVTFDGPKDCMLISTGEAFGTNYEEHEG